LSWHVSFIAIFQWRNPRRCAGHGAGRATGRSYSVCGGDSFEVFQPHPPARPGSTKELSSVWQACACEHGAKVVTKTGTRQNAKCQAPSPTYDLRALRSPVGSMSLITHKTWRTKLPKGFSVGAERLSFDITLAGAVGCANSKRRNRRSLLLRPAKAFAGAWAPSAKDGLE